ncbi:hypothetical protein QGM71_12480 [Virgibacillus sp. C22-A2]|uniref:Uncharacterized protein n=1 Tax=Virgibacillus tibetensis TaxID=3042313 RepID=A0ABU6KGT8_9BACI|nr:hypothetical protein [Virgibacillus sp. C22-A2]
MTDSLNFKNQSHDGETSPAKGNANTMDEKQALGYMLLACKEVGLSPEQIKKIHSRMVSKFKSITPDESEKEGEKWLSLDQQKTINTIDKENQRVKKSKPKYRRANVKIPKVPESHHTRKLREKNERIIMELQHLQDGPFGLFRLFRRCKR